ncbi:MAG TPA: NHLP bacteriocin system secretion protein [Longimicrobium sp.]|jgi:HlyD family secretion protein
MKKHLFRKASVERLSSPEQLDQIMHATHPRGWIALSGMAVLLACAVGWGFTGSVADKVEGRGILVRSGGVLEVVTPAPGRVTDISVDVGDSVTAGQVVGWLAQPELFEEIQVAKARLKVLHDEHQALVGFTRRDAGLEGESLRAQKAALDASIRAAEANLGPLQERIASQNRLVEQGLLTRATLLVTQQQLDAAREKIRVSRSELAQLQVKELEVENDAREAIRNSESKIRDTEAEVARLERDIRARTQVTTPYTGRILEIMTEPGKVVERGEPLLSLDLRGSDIKDLVAVLFVPSIYGKMVKPGMRINIAPSTVRKEEFGMMLGTVTFVSDFPATPMGIRRVLKNDKLVEELFGGASPYEVHADLMVDPSTPSNYRWTSSRGPASRIESGTLAAASITVTEQPPVALVLPQLRQWLER